MPIGLVAAGIGAAGVIGGAVISGNASKSAAQTSANASQSAQQEQARQFDASQAAIREGTANANAVQGQQHDATTGTLDGLYANSNNAIHAGYATAKAANDPYLTAGTSALNQLAKTYGLNYTNDNGETVTGGGAINTGDFYKSPDYNFQLNEGIKGVDAGAAARGSLDSGATRKAEIKYAGNLASGQFNNYASRLAALAGVGQTAAANAASGATNYTNAITANNNTYGARIADENAGYATRYGNAQLGQGTNLAGSATAYGNNYAQQVQYAANNQANATLANGANTSNAINGLAGQATSFLTNPANKNIFSSSYAPPGQSTGTEFGWT